VSLLALFQIFFKKKKKIYSRHSAEFALNRVFFGVLHSANAFLKT